MEIRKTFVQGGGLAVTIPKRIRANLGIRPGDYLCFVLTVDRKIQIEKTPSPQTEILK